MPSYPWLAEVGPARPATADVPSASPIYRHKCAKLGFPADKVDFATLFELFDKSAAKYPNNPCLGKREKQQDGTVGPFVFKSYAEVAKDVASAASGLRALGVEPQQRVGVFGANSPEWMTAMQVGGRVRARACAAGGHCASSRRQRSRFRRQLQRERSLGPGAWSWCLVVVVVLHARPKCTTDRTAVPSRTAYGISAAGARYGFCREVPADPPWSVQLCRRGFHKDLDLDLDLPAMPRCRWNTWRPCMQPTIMRHAGHVRRTEGTPRHALAAPPPHPLTHLQPATAPARPATAWPCTACRCTTRWARTRSSTSSTTRRPSPSSCRPRSWPSWSR